MERKIDIRQTGRFQAFQLLVRAIKKARNDEVVRYRLSCIAGTILWEEHKRISALPESDSQEPDAGKFPEYLKTYWPSISVPTAYSYMNVYLEAMGKGLLIPPTPAKKNPPRSERKTIK